VLAATRRHARRLADPQPEAASWLSQVRRLNAKRRKRPMTNFP